MINQLVPSFEQSLYGLSPAWPCGVAVSGGGDSVALLRLLLSVTRPENLMILHFNHNLREDAWADQEWVGALANEFGVRCRVGHWDHGTLSGNVQQKGRWSRYSFFKETCAQYGLKGVFVGHTQDDVAENLLMRLGRGSGLKGLAAMKPETTIAGVRVMRPMLDFSRDELRAYLKEVGQEWLDDSSNENEDFMRVRVRGLKNSLASAGISFESIVASAKSLKRAEDAVQATVQNFNKRYTESTKQGVLIDHEILHQPQEIALQVMEEMMLKVNPAPFAPRTTKRQRALEKMRAGELPYSLGGVTISADRYGFIFEPEKA